MKVSFTSLPFTSSSAKSVSTKTSHFMKTSATSTMVSATLLAVMLASSGCGQKGALYLPNESDSQAVVTPTAANTNLDDLDNLDYLKNPDNDLSFLDPATEQQILDDPNNY